LWNTGATTSSINVTTGGVYKVTVFSAGCGPVTDTVTVGQATVPTAWNSGPVCSGQPLYLLVANYDNATYNWTGPNGFTSTDKNPVINNAVLSNAGTYGVQVTTNGCTTAPGFTTVIVNQTPPTPVAGNNTPICSGALLNLTATTIPGVTYNWTGITYNGFSSTLQNPSIANATANDSGRYYVTASLNGCKSPPDSTTVIIKPNPPIISIGNNGPLCVGSNLILFATSSTGVSFNWTGPNGFTSTSQNPVINNAGLINAGTYSVSATLNGCTGSTASTNVIINPIPSPPVAGNNGPLCLGETLNLTATTIAGATYNWTGPNGYTSSVQNPVINNINPSHVGKYYITVTVNGCTSPPDSTVFILKTSPGRPTAGNNGPLCVGSTLNLTATTVAGATYSWTGPNGFTSTLQNPVINNITSANGGDYYVSSIVNSCPSFPDTTKVTVISLPLAPSAGNNGPLCVGANLNLTANAIPGATYSWTGPNGFTSNLQNPVINNVALSDSGLYSVAIAENGCIGPGGTTRVVINPIPAKPSAGNNGPLCEGGDINLNANTIAGGTYNWSGPNGFTSSLQNPVIPNVPLSSAGMYSVTVTVNGCTSPADNTMVVVHPAPARPKAGNNGVLCTGSTLNLSASNISNASFNWKGPNGFNSSQQNPVINNVTLADAGIYSVEAIVNGCRGQADSTDVVIRIVPPSPVPGSNSPVCSGDPLLLNTPSVAGIAYSWSGPDNFTSTQQNPVIPNTALINGGTYTLTLIGCTSKVNTTNVVIKPTPSMPQASNNGPLCEGSTLNLSTPSIAGALYKWNGPNNFSSAQQNPAIPNVLLSQAGTYGLTVTDNGCVSPLGSTLVNINKPVIANAGSDQIVCAENNVVNISGTVTGGSNTGMWSSNGTGTFLPGNTFLIASYTLTNADKAAGNVTLTLTSTNNGGCPVSVSSLLVTIPSVITVDAGSDQNICASDNKATLNGIINGAPGGIWNTSGDGVFSPGNTSLNAEYIFGVADKKKGNVTLKLVSTGNGNCTAVTDSTIISILPGPQVSAGPDKLVIENSAAILEPNVAGQNLTYLWAPNINLSNDTIKNPVVTAVGDLTYTLTVTDNAGCFNKDDVFVKVLKVPLIPNTFSPNNDGVNDLWLIKNLEDYPGCRVSVFNRYGQIIFESRGYSKPWDGYYKNKPLPFGTYYYIIDPGNTVKPQTGFVTILK
jgi:gliding motility-associated-like protein